MPYPVLHAHRGDQIPCEPHHWGRTGFGITLASHNPQDARYWEPVCRDCVPPTPGLGIMKAKGVYCPFAPIYDLLHSA